MEFKQKLTEFANKRIYVLFNYFDQASGGNAFIAGILKEVGEDYLVIRTDKEVTVPFRHIVQVYPV